YIHSPDQHSFPTRRSSDLNVWCFMRSDNAHVSLGLRWSLVRPPARMNLPTSVPAPSKSPRGTRPVGSAAEVIPPRQRTAPSTHTTSRSPHRPGYVSTD